jgi:hypothetical protein
MSAAIKPLNIRCTINWDTGFFRMNSFNYRPLKGVVYPQFIIFDGLQVTRL